MNAEHSLNSENGKISDTPFYPIFLFGAVE